MKGKRAAEAIRSYSLAHPASAMTRASWLLMLSAGVIGGGCRDDSRRPDAPLPSAATPTADVSAPPELAALPPPTPCAGVDGFRAVYEVRFASAPEQVHQLELTQVFPARAHWCLSYTGPGVYSRVIELQAGSRAWHHPADAQAAVELPPAERADFERRNALRRALVLWPDGVEWRPVRGATDSDSNSILEAPVLREGEPEELGRLTVRLGAEGRPIRAAVSSPAGSVQEELREIAWKAHGARYWPASATLWAGGELVWSERLISASTQVSLQDSYFRPRGAVHEPTRR